MRREIHSPAGLGREIARRRVVALCLVFFVAILLAGPLRKWMSPELHQYLAFIHLPILFALYIYCLIFNMWPRMTALLAISIVMAAGVVVIAAAQAMQGAIIAPEVAISTWIGYFAFIPLCHIVADYFTRRDIEKFAVVSLFFLSVNAAIMYVQKDFRADDAINQGIGQSADEIFSGLRLIDEFTRPMGLFTSPLANSVFITFAISLCWALFVTTRPVRLGGWFFWPALVAAGASLVLAGSRYAIISFVLMAAAAIGGAALSPRATARLRGVTQAVAALLVVAAIGMAAFGDSADILSKRFGDAWAEEEEVYRSGTLSRLLLETDIDEILDNMAETPFLGYGLGTGSNAAYILDYIPAELYREAPWAKHMNDLGLFFAVFYILLRFAFVLHAAAGSLGALRRWGDPAALVLLSQSGVQMAVGQTVSHVVVGPLTWLFFGLLLGWLRQSREEAPEEARQETREAAAARPTP